MDLFAVYSTRRDAGVLEQASECIYLPRREASIKSSPGIEMG